MYNILVCDDDKEIVEAIEIYLTQEGYHILKAYDGAEALEDAGNAGGAPARAGCDDAQTGRNQSHP